MYLKKIRAFIYFILILFLTVPVQAQIFGFSNEKEEPDFSYKVTPYPELTRDSVRLEVTMRIPYSSIQFLKDNEQYSAHFETSIYIHDSEDERIASFIDDHKISTEIYQKTSSMNHYKIVKKTFFVTPGKYEVTLVFNDFETQKTRVQKEKVDVSNYYESPITVSSINIIERADSTADSASLAITNTLLDTSNKFIIAFHVLTEGGKGELKYAIYDKADNLIKGKTFLEKFKKGITRIYIPVSKKSLLYSEYKLKITIKLEGKTVEKETTFQLQWLGMSSYIVDFSKAIEQLAYITTRKEINRISKGDREEMKNKFLEFWKSKDPTPGTEKNELMIEYYRRVYYANRNFSEGMEGWKTDRGRIYIIYGPPDHVDRHPFELNTKPYIVWRYYNLNKTFYFVDETGFGDYRLINPAEAYY